MTCVIAIVAGDRTILAGDSFCGEESLSNLCKAPKVYTVGPVGIGISGALRTEQILEKTLRYHLPRKKKITHNWLINDLTEIIRKAMKEPGALTEKDSVSEFTESSYILTFQNTIYLFEGDFGLWSPARNFAAIGLGRGLAVGALAQCEKRGWLQKDPERCALEALEIAADWSTWVRGPFLVIGA
mgnify:CR=1 FL=1